MVNSWPVCVLAGTVLGFLSGLGVGGGSLLILWLTLVLEIPQEIARGINLLFFLPSAAVASLLNQKRRAVDFGRLLPAILGGCLSALLGTIAEQNLQGHTLKQLFGILLLLTGARELCWKPKAKQGG